MPVDLTKLQVDFRVKVEALLPVLAQYQLQMFLTEGFRSSERQDELYAQGRTKPGRVVTQAKGGQSPHNHGLAVDFAFVKGAKQDWKKFGHCVRLVGLEWGGDWNTFKDRPHVQMKQWRYHVHP
jgi:peptidoglycan L-alanyl-D-glutamate endopeptidase CwlK